MTTSGLMLMGHGTKSPKGQAQFHELVALAAQRFDGPVTGGFIELAQPSMSDAIDEIATKGIDDLIIAPVVLLPAGHLKDDAAQLANYARQRWPRLAVHLASDLGTTSELIDRLNQRIDAVDMATQAILVVGRGSSDPSANAELHAITRLVSESRRYPLAHTAFVSLTPPDVTAGLETLALLGAQSVVVAPYFLFHGVLLDRIGQQAADWAAARDIPVHVSEELGPHSLIIDSLWLRVQEAIGGVVRTSCDTCLYRSPISIKNAMQDELP
ncbi:sirohydrochlorin chelatase [Ferrimicrobium sp.]|uniref:sirohydrochlorin chelatase n=1 Tax=Ferrimicrobium sp. TaxID=2926050 RepID=UPI00261AFE33|nr:sirohydrochlorin chelatase [Ferrimicrobium sp.]